ncbi:hypothetical protein [Candidatus Nitrospira bockiana]
MTLDELLDHELRLGLTATWCRSDLATGVELKDGKPRVDREARIIYGFSVVTKRPALGHNMLIDDTTLDQVVEHGNKAKRGIKARFDHPNASSTSMGTTIGRAVNFRRDGNRVRADLHLLAATASAPGGDRAEHVLDLAEEAPDLFGASMVFEGEHEMQKNEDGSQKTDSKGRPLPKLARVSKLWATDVVDEPAANAGGFLSAESSLAAKVTGFLNRWAEHDLLPKVSAMFAQLTTRMEALMSESTAQTFSQEDINKARAEGQKAERERIAGVQKALLSVWGSAEKVPASERAAEAELIAMGASVDEAERTFKLRKLSVIQAAAPPSSGGSVETSVGELTEEQRWERDWESQAELRTEYPSKEAFLAFKRREAQAPKTKPAKN